MLLALPSSAAGVLGQALRSAAGVHPLSAQVAEAVRIAPRTELVERPVPAPLSHAVAVVNDNARQQLLKAIGDLSATAAKNAQKASSVVMAFVVAAIALGVSASIAGFCKASMLAGILSILTTATVGANNTLPFRDDASTYKYVSAESSALFTQAQLELQLTEDQYNHYKDQLQKLATYGDSNDVSGSTEDLSKFLQTLHATAYRAREDVGEDRRS